MLYDFFSSYNCIDWWKLAIFCFIKKNITIIFSTQRLQVNGGNDIRHLTRFGVRCFGLKSVYIIICMYQITGNVWYRFDIFASLVHPCFTHFRHKLTVCGVSIWLFIQKKAYLATILHLRQPRTRLDLMPTTRVRLLNGLWIQSSRANNFNNEGFNDINKFHSHLFFIPYLFQELTITVFIVAVHRKPQPCLWVQERNKYQV